MNSSSVDSEMSIGSKKIELCDFLVAFLCLKTKSILEGKNLLLVNS